MMNEHTMQNLGDAFSLTVLFGYFFSSLPVVALVLTIVWTALRIWEMCTVRNLRGKPCYEPSSGEH